MTEEENRFKQRTIVLSQIPILLMLIYILAHIYTETDPLFTQEYSDKVARAIQEEMAEDTYINNEFKAISPVQKHELDSFLLELSIFIFLACVLVAGWVSVVHINRSELANKQLVLLNKQLIDMQEEERARVSRELHDGINQILVSTKMRFENIENANPNDQILMQTDLGRKSVDLAMDEIRRISKALRPAVLDDFGLVVAIENLAKECRTRSGIDVVFEHQIDESLCSRNVEHALYRVAQEAIHNAEKYSKSNAIDIVLQEEKSQIVFTVADDGKGFDLSDVENRNKTIESGMGLTNIRKRIELIGGLLEVNSDPDDGTEIRVTFAISMDEERNEV